MVDKEKMADPKAALKAEWKAKVDAAGVQIVRRVMFDDDERLAGVMTTRDSEGVEYIFEMPKGAVRADFEKDMLAVAAHRHAVRHVPGD